MAGAAPIHDLIGTAFAGTSNNRLLIGEILVRKTADGFMLSHRDDETREDLRLFRDPKDALGIARFDDSESYRPLRTAPNLRHGWRLELVSVDQVELALAYFYPGRMPVFEVWKKRQVHTTPLRETLNRQSGMYRVAAKISDADLNKVVADFCRSDGGCLRTILWKRDQSGAVASSGLPPEKFDPDCDQFTGKAKTDGAALIPLLCQESCNLLVNECRKAVQRRSAEP